MLKPKYKYILQKKKQEDEKSKLEWQSANITLK